MEWAALISWIVTAGGGFVLFSLWLRHGGMRQREPGRHIRPPLILSHFALAATGLVLCSSTSSPTAMRLPGSP
jgi:hypothetical protein